MKPDGIIASDGGVIEVLKKHAPDVDIHISTQANVVSYHTSKFWYNNGAKRVILGREMNKEQIKELMKSKPKDLEVEMFIHGALCFGYSGRCFLSDFLSGRSANLGDCIQSCRWAYNVYVEEKNNPGELMPVEEDNKGTYIFSSKDLCLIKEIPEYYVASVINAYRCAIDEYNKNPENYDYTKYLKELDKTKTRSLTTFYFNDRENKDIQEYEGKQYNPNYEFAGKVVDIENDKVIIEIRNKLSVGDVLEIIVPRQIEPYEFKISELWDVETSEEINTVNPGKANQKVKMKIPFNVKKDWILRRKK